MCSHLTVTHLHTHRIKHTKHPSSPHPSTSTPSVLTAVTSSHSLFSQTPISPLRSGTESPRGQKFHLDAGSSVANSVNQDSDESEINAPRYTYAVSTPSPAESETHLRAQVCMCVCVCEVGGCLCECISLVPRLLGGGEERAWYTPFAHALH